MLNKKHILYDEILQCFSPKEIDQLLWSTCGPYLLVHNAIFHIHNVADSEFFNRALLMSFHHDNLKQEKSEHRIPLSILVGHPYKVRAGERFTKK